MRSLKTLRSDEQGIALVMALLMVLAVSIVTGSLVMVARSEALSSTSYTSMSQVRYGAESGIHAAANYLMNTYASPSAASPTRTSGCTEPHPTLATIASRSAGSPVSG